jgi:hypothetical protein
MTHLGWFHVCGFPAHTGEPAEPGQEDTMPVTFQEPPVALAAITNERAFQQLVVDALRMMGWVVIASEDSRVQEVGIPDLLCFRAGRGEMLELKIGMKGLSVGQRRWQERRLPDGTVVHLIRNTTADWRRMMEIMA